jgi:hypothetical protein
MNLKSEKEKFDKKSKSNPKKIDVVFWKDDNPSSSQIDSLVKHAESKGYKCLKSSGFGFPVGFVAFK